MAKHASPETVPDNPDDFLEQFNTFSIYEILPQLKQNRTTAEAFADEFMRLKNQRTWNT